MHRFDDARASRGGRNQAAGADGLSNREIGEHLVLSPRTVSTHLHHVFRKLHVSHRHELADRAFP